MDLGPDTHVYSSGKLDDPSSKIGLMFFDIKPYKTELDENNQVVEIYPDEAKLRELTHGYDLKVWTKEEANAARKGWYELEGCQGFFNEVGYLKYLEESNEDYQGRVALQDQVGAARIGEVKGLLGDKALSRMLQDESGVSEVLDPAFAFTTENVGITADGKVELDLKARDAVLVKGREMVKEKTNNGVGTTKRVGK